LRGNDKRGVGMIKKKGVIGFLPCAENDKRGIRGFKLSQE
jgi:hypothetical protein